jgi:hypothetical protein
LLIFYCQDVEPVLISQFEIVKNSLSLTLNYTQKGNFKNILCFTNESSFNNCPADLILNKAQISYDLRKYLIHGGKYEFYILTFGCNSENVSSNAIKIKTGILSLF